MQMPSEDQIPTDSSRFFCYSHVYLHHVYLIVKQTLGFSITKKQHILMNKHILSTHGNMGLLNIFDTDKWTSITNMNCSQLRALLLLFSNGIKGVFSAQILVLRYLV